VPAGRIEWHLRRLVSAGHKVGVVQQTESAAIKAAGDNRSKPFERELAAVYTRATLEAGALAGPARGGGGAAASEEDAADAAAAGGPAPQDAAWSSEQRSAYLLCLVEEHARGGGGVEVGLVAVETSTGDVLHSQFADGPMRAELERRLMFAAPSELLVVQPVAPPTQRLLAGYGSGAAGVRTEAVPGGAYRGGGALAAVTAFYGGGDAGGAGTSAPPAAGLGEVLALPPLVLRALAHALDYLRPFGLDGVLRLGPSFREFSAAAELALSPNTLAQLEVLRNADDGGERGSLLWLMDRTLTAPGSRLMRTWVSRPLREVAAIEERLDAVEELLQGQGASRRRDVPRRGWCRRCLGGCFFGAGEECLCCPSNAWTAAATAAPSPAGAAWLTARRPPPAAGAEHATLSRLPAALRSLPDLERALTRALHRTSSPPEFLALLRTFAGLHAQLGLEADLDAAAAAAAAAPPGSPPPPPQLAPPPGVRSALLRRLLAAAGDPRCAALARATLASLDEAAAAGGDKLRVFADDARFADVAARRAAVAAAERALEALRPALAAALGVRAVAYVSLQNQGDFLVEVALDMEKRAPRDWERVSSTKKFVRFRPPAVKAALAALEVAREHLAATAAAAWARLLGEFSEHCAPLRAATRALAALDCLGAFASLAAAGGYARPEFVPPGAPPQLHITGGRHPVLDVLLEGGFVANDARLGGGGPGAERCHVITGPNMGGKSCLIRQAALIVCMAQAGSFVPAAAARMHAHDAVFTRMGAADNIALGRSTFLEELRWAPHVPLPSPLYLFFCRTPASVSSANSWELCRLPRPATWLRL
jgi:DNA mismatch repair protein MSH3